MSSFPDHALYFSRRERMVREDISSSGKDRRIAVKSPEVIQAMKMVPRHLFVEREWVEQAYEDSPLSIGHGQTISQPYIVAFMTELLQLKKDGVVLEVGTGSGYQTAILAQIAKFIYSVEIIKELSELAMSRLLALGYTNVMVRVGDGYQGWKEYAPFDAIIVTAAPDHIPHALIEQIKPGGKMVLPIGAASQVQSLTLVEKGGDQTVTQKHVISARFVPLTGEH